MSRIGKQPVQVPDGVTVTVADRAVTVKGPKGQVTQTLPDQVTVQAREDAKQVVVERLNESKRARAFHGLARSLIQNLVLGVTDGYSRALEVHGVGYNVKLDGRNVVLQVGFANPVSIPIPEGVQIDVQQATNPGRLTVSGCDKQLVGLTAAKIRAVSPPEPYQGKGVRYADEIIRRKAGKSFTSTGG